MMTEQMTTMVYSVSENPGTMKVGLAFRAFIFGGGSFLKRHSREEGGVAAGE